MSNYVALKPLLPELTRLHLAYTPTDPQTSLCGLRMAWDTCETMNARNVCRSCMKAYRARLEAFQEKVREETQNG